MVPIRRLRKETLCMDKCLLCTCTSIEACDVAEKTIRGWHSADLAIWLGITANHDVSRSEEMVLTDASSNL